MMGKPTGYKGLQRRFCSVGEQTKGEAMKAYQAKAGKTQFMPAYQDVKDAIEDGTMGFCLACGAEGGAAWEPDARRYTCESCGQPKVYGAEELVIMGLVDTSSGSPA